MDDDGVDDKDDLVGNMIFFVSYTGSSVFVVLVLVVTAVIIIRSNNYCVDTIL